MLLVVVCALVDIVGDTIFNLVIIISYQILEIKKKNNFLFIRIFIIIIIIFFILVFEDVY